MSDTKSKQPTHTAYQVREGKNGSKGFPPPCRINVTRTSASKLSRAVFTAATLSAATSSRFSHITCHSHKHLHLLFC